MLKIITDSCADLEESFVQEHNIGLANLHLQVDGANYTPGEDITTAQALAKIAQAQEMPKPPSPRPTLTSNFLPKLNRWANPFA